MQTGDKMQAKRQTKDMEILKLTINEMKGLFISPRLPYYGRCDFRLHDDRHGKRQRENYDILCHRLHNFQVRR